MQTTTRVVTKEVRLEPNVSRKTTIVQIPAAHPTTSAFVLFGFLILITLIPCSTFCFQRTCANFILTFAHNTDDNGKTKNKKIIVATFLFFTKSVNDRTCVC